MNNQPELRLYKIGGKSVLVQAVDFGLFHEHLRSINKEWMFIQKIDEAINFQQQTIVESSAKVLDSDAAVQ